jgi:hypothetical protein
MRSQAMQAALDAPEEWRIGLSGNCPVDDEAAESGALRFGTRLGQDSESVIPLSPSDLEDLGAGAERLRNRYLRISHPQLLQAVRAAPTPTGWRTLPGLAHHLPLRLDEEGRVLGTGLASRLDPVLGLVLGELG